jgi:hypothetical protein
MKVFGFAKIQWHLQKILNFEFFFVGNSTKLQKMVLERRNG